MTARLLILASAAAALLAGCEAEPAAPGEPALVFTSSEWWPQPSLLPPATGARLVVTNSGDDTVEFIDPLARAAIGTVPVGVSPLEKEGPHHLVASPDGSVLYVGISNLVPLVTTGPHGSHGTGTADGYLLRVDAVTGRETGRVRVRRSPGDVLLGPGAKLVYQSHFDLVTVGEVLARNGDVREMDSSITAVDAESFEKVAEVKVCPAGHGMGLSPDGETLYVACYMSDELGVVRLSDLSVQRISLGPDGTQPPLPSYQPYAVTVSPADGRIWVSNTGPGYRGLRVVEPDLSAPGLELATTGAPMFGQFTEDGSTLFLVTQSPDRLLRIDPASATIQAELDLEPLGCKNAHAARLPPGGAELYVICEGDHATVPGTLEFLDPADLSPLGHVVVGLFPDEVAYLPAPRGTP